MAQLKYFILVCIFLNIFSFDSVAGPPVNGQTISIGKSYTIESTALQQAQTIWVGLPVGYQTGEQKYAVVYLIDGKKFFAFGAALLTRLNDTDRIPAAITVAVDVHTQGRALNMGSSQAANFLTFIEKDLIPFVDSNFRTNARRTLAGWQKGGGFVIDTLVKRPDLFEGYIAASPYLADDYSLDFSESSALFAKQKREKYLYMGVTDGEFGYDIVVKSLVSQIEKAAPKGLVWDFHVASTKSELMVEHELSLFSTLPKGLVLQHGEYKSLRFNDAADFTAKGGMDFVKTYYAKRARRYDLAPEIDSNGLWSLLRVAMAQDNIVFFSELMALKNRQGSKTHVNWMLRYAAFFQKHGKTKDAIAYYYKTAKLNPRSVKTLQGLGDTYVAVNQTQNAVKTYTKAIALAKAQSHELLSVLQGKLASF
ncbi:MAG: hypothetical protein HRT35_36510 [Algicola sp.]|nr:hypothetical protein [Algicola sp.]